MIVSKKSIITFLGIFLMAGSLFLVLPQSGFAQIEGCCQLQNETTGQLICSDSFGRCRIFEDTILIDFFEDSTCNEQTGACSGFLARDVPTLSEWGLIAMAGVLGIVGFMVMRRKRATA